MFSFQRGFFVLLILMVSCAGPKVRTERGQKPWQAFFEKHFMTSQALGSSVLVGEAQIYESRTAIVHLKSHVALGADFKIRIEVENLIGQTILVVVGNGRHLWIAEPPHSRCQLLQIETGALHLPTVNISIPLPLLFSFISSYPLHLASPLKVDWKEANLEGHQIRYSWNNTAFDFESLESALPKSMTYIDGDYAFQQEFVRWEHLDQGYLAKKWRLRTSWQQKKAVLMWTWQTLELREAAQNLQLFQKPELESCLAP